MRKKLHFIVPNWVHTNHYNDILNIEEIKMNTKPFVYLWFDSKNRKFYLGYHGGHPDDNYTHSSTVMESFTKKTIPSYMHRRVLATGTEQEMKELENKLLENRKRCPRRWDKYYNITVAFPPPPKRGEDHPCWKGGITFDMVEYQRQYREENIERLREKDREYREKNREKIREYFREYRPEYNAKNAERLREKGREWREKVGPEYYREYRAKNREKLNERRRKNRANNERLREKDRQYYQKNREKIREVARQYYQENAEKVLEQNRKWRKENPEKIREYERQRREKNREKLREYHRQYRARKKAEKAGNSLDITKFVV